MSYDFMFISDLDGTLLNSQQLVPDNSLQDLIWMGKNKVCRVIATGRSYFSFCKVIPQSFPIDYLVFSTGAGIMHWESKSIIHQHHLEAHQANHIADIFRNHSLNFMLHQAIPHNHYFNYYINSPIHPDFEARCKLYSDFAANVDYWEQHIHKACQLITIKDNNNEDLSKLYKLLNEYNIIKSTSPLDNKSIWLEVFAKQVSKGNAAKWLMNYLNVNIKHSASIGNDYNDEDLLDITFNSFIMDNAAHELKLKYKKVASNDNQGFSQAVSLCYNK